jgi:uncharacterized protein YecE (DUF72 family)
VAHARARIGCSGWEYDEWRGDFYPADLPKRAWFEHYARTFDTVEVNGTFYRLPEPKTFDRWREQAPSGFCYALKLSQFATHRKRLLDPWMWLPRFFERADRLGPLLGPILVQLPPRWRPEPQRLDDALARAPADRRLAIEVRDARWLSEPVYAVLAAHGEALVRHDLIPDHPDVVTADFVYERFHGPTASSDGGPAYTGSYSPQALTAAARRIRAHLAAGRDAYAYFNNDIGGHAVRDALSLRRYVGD